VTGFARTIRAGGGNRLSQLGAWATRSAAERRATRTRRGASGHPRGFTLIEAALATIIIGVGVVALVEAHQAFMRTNQWSSHAAAATYLGNELREYMRELPKHDPASGLWFDSGTLQGWGRETGEVTLADFDDLDDFDGIAFGSGIPLAGFAALETLPGPVDSSGFVIPELFADGSIMLDATENPVPMLGWTQLVRVTKVDPTNMSIAVPDETFQPPAGIDPGRAVDDYPVRVTVIVGYAGPWDPQGEVITTVSWIVP
jgi:type II secretory pathway pseudopilin PulG